MNKEISGEIEAISQKKTKSGKDRYGVCIGDNIWFNGWGLCQFAKGDNVRIEYEVAEKFGNSIVSITKITEFPIAPAPEGTPEQKEQPKLEVQKHTDLRQRQIVRQSMLKCATEIIIAYEKGVIVEQAIKDIKILTIELEKFVFEA